jgi:hypothetical protein
MMHVWGRARFMFELCWESPNSKRNSTAAVSKGVLGSQIVQCTIWG